MLEGVTTAEWGVLELAPSCLLPALFRVNLEQVSHLWPYWHFGLGNSLSRIGVFLMHCRMFSSIPILCILNSSGNPPIVTIKSIFRYCQMSPRAQNWLWFRTTDLESRYFTSAAVVPSCSNSWIQAALLPTLADPAFVITQEVSAPAGRCLSSEPWASPRGNLFWAQSHQPHPSSAFLGNEFHAIRYQWDSPSKILFSLCDCYFHDALEFLLISQLLS